MGFQAQNSIAALVKETTENVLKWPTAGAEFIALQEAPAIDPGNSPLENAEFTGGLDPAAPISGPFAPSFSLIHYLRHSGVEGQKPNYDLLLEMAFGAVEVEATQQVTIAGSTAGTASVRGIIKVGVGIGATFKVGQGLLIKDGANGYSIRCIYSITTDDLGLNFNLSAAPGTGIGLGKAIFHESVNSGHPTASFFDYRANEAAIQAVSGLRVTSMTLEPSAEELINATFALEGLDLYYNPVEIVATNKFIDFVDDGGTKVASVAEKTYKSPIALASALQSAMNAVSVDIWTVAFSKTTGKYTISSDGSTTASLLWKTGVNGADGTDDHIGTTLGYSDAADDTGAFSYLADNALSYASVVTPAVDSEPPLVAVHNSILIGTFADNVCFSTRSLSVSLENEKVNTPDMCERSGKSGSTVVRRISSVSIIANLPKHDAEKFQAMIDNTDVAFQWAFGKRDSSDNWIPGRCGVFYLRQAKVSTHALGTADDEVTLEISISGFGIPGSYRPAFLSYL